MIPRLSLRQRFWSKVAMAGPDECWRWMGALRGPGGGEKQYGHMVVWAGGLWRHRAAHRVAWELEHGEVPDGAVVCHRCDNRRCVNVAHLFVGTQSENLQDMVRKGRNRPARGVRSPFARLTDSDVVRIRERYAAGEGQRALGAEYGVDGSSVYRIVTGQKWTHVGGPIHRRPA